MCSEMEAGNQNTWFGELDWPSKRIILFCLVIRAVEVIKQDWGDSNALGSLRGQPQAGAKVLTLQRNETEATTNQEQPTRLSPNKAAA